MKLKNLLLIREILEENRRWILELSNDYYSNLEFSHEGDKVSGLCAISAYRVYRDLNKNNFHSKFTLSHCDYGSHCFNKLGNYLIDVTGDQFSCKSFNISPIVFRKFKDLKDIEKRWFWGFQDEDFNSFGINEDFVSCMSIVSNWDEFSPQHIFPEIEKEIKNDFVRCN